LATPASTSDALVGLVQGAEKLGYRMRVSSGGVRSGHRDDGSGGHAGGKAIDFDGINGQPVGYNKQTWKFVADMIDQGNVGGIGTIPEIANDPQMQRHAAERGVHLFADPGTGPHVHVQVR